VCAGAKAILDLPKTLEYLETMGVPVIGVGTDEFPAFFVSSSGLPVTHRLNTTEDIAKLLDTHRRLQLSSGMLIANPPPAERALKMEEAETVIQQAVQKAHAAGVSGNAVTPYLLGEVANDTGGKSVEANQALLISNARLAAQIARSLAKLSRTA
jgi:pseudouridine-5'-phosphate glycosidase